MLFIIYLEYLYIRLSINIYIYYIYIYRGDFIVRRTTTVLVEDALIEQAKAEGLNISRTVEAALTKALNVTNTKDFKTILDMLLAAKEKLESTILSVEERLNTIKASEDMRNANILKVMKEAPELANLTAQQLGDYPLLTSLVDVVRKKYNVRIGITDIREFYAKA